MISLGPLADPMEIARRRGRVSTSAPSLLPARIHILIIAILGSAGLHGDVDVTSIGVRKRRLVSLDGAMRGTRFATEMALQPLGGFKLPRLIFLLQVQRLLRQHVLSTWEAVCGEACGKSLVSSKQILEAFVRRRRREDLPECLWKRVVRMTVGDGVQSPIRSPSVDSAT